MWTFLDEVDEDSLTVAEWERIYLLVNQLGLPHAEIDLDPAHCPTCRTAHAVVILERETSMAEAVMAISAMPAASLIDAFLSADG